MNARDFLAELRERDRQRYRQFVRDNKPRYEDVCAKEIEGFAILETGLDALEEVVQLRKRIAALEHYIARLEGE